MRRAVALPVAWTLAAMTSLLDVGRSQSDSCQNATRNSNTGGSCSFDNGDECGWHNLEGDDLDWVLRDRSYFGQNSYIKLDTEDRPAGSAGYLSSPKLCATGSDLHSVSFRYSIESNNRCRLSVYLVTEVNSTRVWTTRRATGVDFSDMVDPIYIRCPPLNYYIVFVGEKLSWRSCGFYYDEIDVDDIRYSHIGQSSIAGSLCPSLPPTPPTVPSTTTTTTTTTTTSTTTSTTTTTTTRRPTSTTTTTKSATKKPNTTQPLPPVFTKKPTATTATPALTTRPAGNATATDSAANGLDHGPHNQDTAGLSGGAVAGVVVAVVAVIAIVAFLVVLLAMRRRREQGSKMTTRDGGLTKETKSVANNAYMLNTMPVLPSAPPPVDYADVIPSQPPRDVSAPPDYDVAGLPANYGEYSVPDDMTSSEPCDESNYSEVGDAGLAMQQDGAVTSGSGQPFASTRAADGEATSGLYNQLSGPQPRPGSDVEYWDPYNHIPAADVTASDVTPHYDDPYHQLSGRDVKPAQGRPLATDHYDRAGPGNDAAGGSGGLANPCFSVDDNDYSLADDVYCLADAPPRPAPSSGKRVDYENVETPISNTDNSDNGHYSSPTSAEAYSGLVFEDAEGAGGDGVEYFNESVKEEHYDRLHPAALPGIEAEEETYYNLGSDGRSSEI